MPCGYAGEIQVLVGITPSKVIIENPLGSEVGHKNNGKILI
jgi:hypothetical protein